MRMVFLEEKVKPFSEEENGFFSVKQLIQGR